MRNRMFIPLCIGVVFHLMCAHAAPKLVCPSPVYDYGRVDNIEVVEHAYVVQNRGDEVLEIKRLKASCGCTVAEAKKRSLAPGEQTKVLVKMDLKGRSGPQKKTVLVESNDPNHPGTTLTIQGVAVPLVTVRPRQLLALVKEKEEGFSRQVGVESHEPGPFEILSTEITHSNLTVRVVDDQQERRKTIVLTGAAESFQGSLKGTLSIRTNSKKVPVIEIPYRVVCRNRS